jgi:hypothetical protein
MNLRAPIAHLVLLWAAVSPLASGCSSSSASSPGGGGRGSSACNDWQSAVCGFVQQCPGNNPALCDQTKAIVCKSDPAASACAAKFHANGCSTDPTGCQLGDMADPAPAIAACKQFAQAICDTGVRCGGAVTTDCATSYETQLECNGGKVLGVKLTFDSCLADLKVADCASTALPTSCNAVLLTSQ